MKWLKLFVHLLHCDLIVFEYFCFAVNATVRLVYEVRMNDIYAVLIQKRFLLPDSVIWELNGCGMLIWFDGIVWSIEFYAFPWVECLSEWTISESSTWLIVFEFDMTLMSYPIWFIRIWSTSSWTFANLWPHLHRLLTFVDMCSLIICSIAVDISTSASPHVVQTHTCFFTLNGVNVCCEHRFYIFWMLFEFWLITLDESIVFEYVYAIMWNSFHFLWSFRWFSCSLQS